MVSTESLVWNIYNCRKRTLWLKKLNQILTISFVQILFNKVFFKLTFKHVTIVKIHVKTWVNHMKCFVNLSLRYFMFRLEVDYFICQWLC